MKISVTSTTFGMKRYWTHCSESSEINVSPLVPPTLINENHGKQPSPSVPQTRGILRARDNIVCLVQARKDADADAECRVCLRQIAAYDSLGKFLLVIISKEYFLFVIRTVHEKSEIISACTARGACTKFQDNIYPDHVCQEVHSTRASENCDYEPEISAVDGNLHCYRVIVPYYLSKSSDISGTWNRAVNALANREKQYVHMFNFNLDLPHFVLLLLWSRSVTTEDDLSGYDWH
uniref:AlNc14C130G6931 protein n=1 Tax=Albugo laibachii Nc14 TaxID=890382 RepID=F0WK79_9STRA|nr:AlNc14C130G6931 [Albugo laibachii Nc14]|eukprot:CCA21682.1 AlNc14C130G6931 [Albugo laibachii Nc14]